MRHLLAVAEGWGSFDLIAVRQLVRRAFLAGDHVRVLLGRAALLLGTGADLHVVERQQRRGPGEDHVPEQRADHGDQHDRTGQLARQAEG